MNTPTKHILDIFNSFTCVGANLNWCEKVGAWCVFTYDRNVGNKKFATILVDRKRK